MIDVEAISLMHAVIPAVVLEGTVARKSTTGPSMKRENALVASRM
ncbi:MAG: hypothetical protein ACYDC6_07225 [Acidobacteriaceae bacterium]